MEEDNLLLSMFLRFFTWEKRELCVDERSRKQKESDIAQKKLILLGTNQYPNSLETMNENIGYPVSGFYNTLREFSLISWLYRKAEDKWFDVYELSKRFTLWISNLVSEAHSGILPGYVVWILAGLIIMLFLMI